MTAGTDPGIAFYTCSMHPSVKQSHPGTCPICSMDLVAVTHAAQDTGEVVIDAPRRQVLGIRTQVVSRDALHLALRTVGRIGYDESAYREVSLLVGGRVLGLAADTVGAVVQQGQPLVTIDSPDLRAAEREYLLAVRRQAAAAAGDPGPAAVVRSTRERLRQWEFSDGQIAALSETTVLEAGTTIFAPVGGVISEKDVVQGAAFLPGQRLFRIAPLDRVWVMAAIFESDLPLVRAGQAVAVTVATLPGRTFAGTIDYLYPALDPATRSVQARIVLANPAMALHPGMYATVALDIDAGPRLVVAKSAVIYSGPRRLVFVDLGEGRLHPVPVTLGLAGETAYEVLTGLNAGDRVVTSGNFLVAAESRIRSAEQYWGGGDDAR